MPGGERLRRSSRAPPFSSWIEPRPTGTSHPGRPIILRVRISGIRHRPAQQGSFPEFGLGRLLIDDEERPTFDLIEYSGNIETNNRLQRRYDPDPEEQRRRETRPTGGR